MLIATIVLLVLIIAGICSYLALHTLSPPTQPTNSSPTAEPTVTQIDPSTLSYEYQQNEVAADLKYKGRLLQLTSSAYEIGRAPTDQGKYSNRAYIRIYYGSSSPPGVICFFKDESEIAKLAKGQQVTVEGTCDGTSRILGELDVVMSDCTLLEKPEGPAEKAEFQLTDWEVEVQPQRALFTDEIESYQTLLSVKYTLQKFGHRVILSLVRPDGFKSGIELTAEEGETSIGMGALNEVPQSGQYKLVATDFEGNVIATETLTIEGTKIEISRTSVQTHLGQQYGFPKEGIYLTHIDITMKNEGSARDLPLLATTLEIYTSEENQAKNYIFPLIGGTQGHQGSIFAVLSGEEKTVGAFQLDGNSALRFGSSGQKIIVLNFKDNTGKVVYSYSATIQI